jgi:heme A synthase
VPTAFAAPACRRPIVLIAAWLIVLQAFLAGVVAAQAAAMAASDPINAICHGAGGAGANDGTVPQSAKIEHLCCAHCISAAPAIAPPDAPRAFRPSFMP